MGQPHGYGPFGFRVAVAMPRLAAMLQNLRPAAPTENVGGYWTCFLRCPLLVDHLRHCGIRLRQTDPFDPEFSSLKLSPNCSLIFALKSRITSLSASISAFELLSAILSM